MNLSKYRAQEPKISAERATPPGWYTTFAQYWSYITALNRADHYESRLGICGKKILENKAEADRKLLEEIKKDYNTHF